MIKIGLVGLGKWGKNHQRVLQQLHDEGKLELVFAKDLDYDPDVDLKLVDAIDFVTPTDLHFEQAAWALNNNKHVFVEKPLTLNYDTALHLVGIADKKERVLAVGHQFRFSWALHQVKLALARPLRKQVYLWMKYHHGDKPPRTDMGAIFNFGSHLFDMLLYLYNGQLPNSVYATALYQLGNPNREDAALITARCGKDVAVLELGWTHPRRTREITMISDKRCLKANLATDYVHEFEIDSDLHDEHYPAKEQKELLYQELAHFVECCETGEEPINSGSAGAWAVLLCERALESAAEHKEIRL